MNQDTLKNEISLDLQNVSKHLVALIQGIAKGYLDLADIDLQKLSEKINAVDTILDGDPDSEGFQNFIVLQQKVVALEGSNAEHTQSIQLLQNAVDNVITSRINEIEAEGRSARKQLDDRISQIVKQHNDHVAAQSLKNSDYDSKLTNNESRLTALEAARALHLQKIDDLENTANKHGSDIQQLKQKATDLATALDKERNRAENEESLIRGELVVERDRVDDLSTQSKTFISREEFNAAQGFAWDVFCKQLWIDANLPMPDHLSLPNTIQV